ncbi:shikimate kinase [Egicoccus sp. AB-alg2]|uniref:shikimate kinase n=1 Tax=Egicoccus sp. AB-alg2 TaxID=3242693 RepID=UPI00359D80B6
MTGDRPRDDAGRTGRPQAGRSHLVLLGMMGAGKTTTGRALADRLGWPLRDGDADLEARTGLTGAQVAARHGVEHLHHLEEEVLLDALAAGTPNVVAAAGWVVESARCRQALRERATVVWLDVPVADLIRRMAAGDHRRPLDVDAADALLVRRRARFVEVADLHLDARAPTADLVERILAAIAGTADRGGVADRGSGAAEEDRP